MINRSCSRSPLIVLSVLLAISSLANAAQKTLSLYHAVNDGNFVKRGTVALDATTEEGLKMVVENDISMDAASIEAMVETGIYSLKIVDEKNDHAVMASVPACQLRRANFRCVIQFVHCLYSSSSGAVPISILYLRWHTLSHSRFNNYEFSRSLVLSVV